MKKKYCIPLEEGDPEWNSFIYPNTPFGFKTIEIDEDEKLDLFQRKLIKQSRNKRLK